jgi:hypothetical protein
VREPSGRPEVWSRRRPKSRRQDLGRRNDAGGDQFGIADLAGFVNLFAGEADVGGRSSVPDGNGGIATARSTDNLTPILRDVEPALGLT